jgi:hypothetical protein
VAGSRECGGELTGSGATELVINYCDITRSSRKSKIVSLSLRPIFLKEIKLVRSIYDGYMGISAG